MKEKESGKTETEGAQVGEGLSISGLNIITDAKVKKFI